MGTSLGHTRACQVGPLGTWALFRFIGRSSEILGRSLGSPCISKGRVRAFQVSLRAPQTFLDQREAAPAPRDKDVVALSTSFRIVFCNVKARLNVSWKDVRKHPKRPLGAT